MSTSVNPSTWPDPNGRDFRAVAYRPSFDGDHYWRGRWRTLEAARRQARGWITDQELIALFIERRDGAVIEKLLP